MKPPSYLDGTEAGSAWTPLRRPPRRLAPLCCSALVALLIFVALTKAYL